MSLVLQGQVGRGEFSREVDVAVERGEILAIVGANGSGKSTVLQTIAGIAALKSGRLSFDNVVWDEPITKTFTPAQVRHCGVVFQDLRLFPHLSLIANVAFGLRASGVSKQDAYARATDELVVVGLDGLANRKPGQVSGGERQRAALARALVMRPQVLLLDEPFASVDVSSRQGLRDLLPALVQDYQGSVVLVSHDPEDVRALATNILTFG
jgi:molybdate transport system ATP-binding protein